MISAVLDHLWQSTLLAAAIAILALAFRKAPASVRFGLWFTASAKFLVPFAAFAALGGLLAPTIRPPSGAATDVVLIADAAAPFARAALEPRPALPVDPTMLLAGAWALGFAAVLILWLVRWAKVRAVLRRATPLAIKAPMPVLGSPTMMEPGLVGIRRPVLLLPDSLFQHLGRPGIDSLVAHEACHFRRRDNLTAAIHMLVEALFWFHPMVWWIGGRMVEERERACDEAVVRSGHDPVVYAESLLACCRLFLQSPLRCVAGASGSNLSRRVEMIMTSPSRSSLSRSGKAALIAAGLCALASPVAAGWLSSPAISQAAPAAIVLVSSPASALADETSAALSAPARRKAGKAPPAPHPYSAPAAMLPRIAATHPDPIQLDAVAGVALSNASSDWVAADAGHLQLAELQVPSPDNGSTGQAAEPASASAPPATSKTVCVNQNHTAGSRIQKRVCMSRDEWLRRQRGVTISGASAFSSYSPSAGR